MHELLFWSGVALVITALLSVFLGWFVAGRVLRPVKVITAKAKAISSHNLHERIGLQGPDDELKEVGDTFDDLLERVDRSFSAQRQFVANASHELRSPLARQRTVLEVALDDPDASVESLKAAGRQVLQAGEEQETLIEALLTLASSERGLEVREQLDVATAARITLAAKKSEADLRGVTIDATLDPSPTPGSPQLVERLVTNLVENGLRHNISGGWLRISTVVRDGHAELTVANSGPVVPSEELPRLLQPFQRLGTERTRNGAGHGLGLSIVQAIATAHDAELTLASRPGGGLDVHVAFPLEVVSDVPATAPAAEPRGSLV